MFTQFEVGRGLPSLALVKHFEQSGSEWRVRERVRRMVQFRQLNLARPFGLAGRFDLVFLRNVLIYFDLDVKTQVLERVRDVLQPSGFLFLGATENTLRTDVGLERVDSARAACYRRLVSRAA